MYMTAACVCYSQNSKLTETQKIQSSMVPEPKSMLLKVQIENCKFF